MMGGGNFHTQNNIVYCVRLNVCGIVVPAFVEIIIHRYVHILFEHIQEHGVRIVHERNQHKRPSQQYTLFALDVRG